MRNLNKKQIKLIESSAIDLAYNYKNDGYDSYLNIEDTPEFVVNELVEILGEDYEEYNYEELKQVYKKYYDKQIDEMKS